MAQNGQEGPETAPATGGGNRTPCRASTAVEDTKSGASGTGRKAQKEKRTFACILVDDPRIELWADSRQWIVRGEKRRESYWTSLTGLFEALLRDLVKARMRKNKLRDVEMLAVAITDATSKVEDAVRRLARVRKLQGDS
jgi:hypothetical protein